MNKREQSKFVADLCGNVSRDLRAKIKAGAVPADWDGHELRVLLAAHFEGEATRSRASMKGKRIAAFRNAVIVQNL